MWEPVPFRPHQARPGVVWSALHPNGLDNHKADKAALLACCLGDSKWGSAATCDPSEAKQRSLAENEYWLLQAGLQAGGMVQLDWLWKSKFYGVATGKRSRQ